MASLRREIQLNTRATPADVERLDRLHQATMPMATRASFTLAVIRAGLRAAEADASTLIDAPVRKKPSKGKATSR